MYLDFLTAPDLVPNDTVLKGNELDLQTGLQTNLQGLPLMVISVVSMMSKGSAHEPKMFNSFIVVTIIKKPVVKFAADKRIVLQADNEDRLP